MCAVSGVLVMSIPIPIIVANFQVSVIILLFVNIDNLDLLGFLPSAKAECFGCSTKENAGEEQGKEAVLILMHAINDFQKVKEVEERTMELEGEKVKRDENARIERKRRREDKREERRRKRKEQKTMENPRSSRQRRQSEKEEGWSEDEWCKLLGGREYDDEEENRRVSHRPGSDCGVVQARNPIYRPRHTQSLADLF